MVKYKGFLDWLLSNNENREIQLFVPRKGMSFCMVSSKPSHYLYFRWRDYEAFGVTIKGERIISFKTPLSKVRIIG